MRLRKYNKIFGMLSLFAAAALLSGCDMALMNPKGQVELEQRSLILTALGLMLIVVIPVIVMTIAFAWKFRASNTKAKYTPNWSHPNKIEAVVWTVPIIIILILGTITWKTTHSLDPCKPLVSEAKPINVEVISLDWKWLFVYPELGIATVNELAFPTNVPVNFKITSDTVMNSFFIPRLGGQIYAMAGMQTKLHFIANEPGKYEGISGGYSGKGFSGMKFTAIATPSQQEFDQWVATVRTSSKTLNSTEEFNTLAKPSEFHPVEYFSSVQPELFENLIRKFTQSGGAPAHHHAEGETQQGSMQHGDNMNMSEHASHQGAEG
ncbi:cytochrome o ubiquinol oxidase subunit II [Candidatus Symbiopectobacterium sp. 'North America']|uniref:cytochrome o ubiquinol oxidase subunit II n=1 Tax=Candidatus Symbiopectobacterium sp. 'North America' TaxID=2794574 RepID=UPI0018C98B86|nr:cytochrome o ubiquinol oxidase subunit II [Candidatus Symbiopectobacterium sp. 'North America']MBG6244166.1 cytochrome o ubiquinol oxidase subunit II [Candidatus Symbiopectobacterium sp. 'North America']